VALELFPNDVHCSFVSIFRKHDSVLFGVADGWNVCLVLIANNVTCFDIQVVSNHSYFVELGKVQRFHVAFCYIR
jgi:hypothetical protein